MSIFASAGVANEWRRCRSNRLTEKKIMKKYVCETCGYVYDPEVGDPDSGIAPGTAFEDIPDDWVCPLCGVGKDDSRCSPSKGGTACFLFLHARTVAYDPWRRLSHDIGGAGASVRNVRKENRKPYNPESVIRTPIIHLRFIVSSSSFFRTAAVILYPEFS